MTRDLLARRAKQGRKASKVFKGQLALQVLKVRSGRLARQELRRPFPDPQVPLVPPGLPVPKEWPGLLAPLV